MDDRKRAAEETSSRSLKRTTADSAAVNIRASNEEESKSELAMAGDRGVSPNIFSPVGVVVPYEWKLPHGTSTNPARGDVEFLDLLSEDVFIDKSAALHHFLKWWFVSKKGDFRAQAFHLVYPRRFAKSTLMQFIEAVYSPVPLLKGYTRESIKSKIASLEKGPELLSFGMHPVVILDLQNVLNVSNLHNHISDRLKRAGLEQDDAEKLKTTSDSPIRQLYDGVQMLNQKFQAEFHVATKTIVLIDEHDKPFRNRANKTDSEILEALVQLFGLGKEDGTGISLFILCGLTRMVGSGISQLNNRVDVSLQTRFHGICGISAREFVNACSGELDHYANRMEEGKTLETLLKSNFIPKWDGFRFGIDVDAANEGELKPESDEGALFSPLDVWVVVQALVTNEKHPLSKWIATMNSEFEFVAFATRFTRDEGFIELGLNLEGGWLDTVTLMTNMDRKDYLLLDSPEHVKKVLFELGLLSVKRIDDNGVLLGSPNWMVTQNAMKVLVKKTGHGSTPQRMANDYLSRNGFGAIVAAGHKRVPRNRAGCRP